MSAEQHCDSTCAFCAREFFKWWKNRVKSQASQAERGDFNAAAATSIKAPKGSA